jgi:HPt (histidine-containing phosphotransfer) domain-containing protein
LSAYFDPARIAQLEQVMGAAAGTMAASMLSSLTGAIERLEAAIAAGERDPAIQAAHAARNDALMLGAGQLQAALSELELAERDGDEARTREALERVRLVWPPTRADLAAAVGARGVGRANPP